LDALLEEVKSAFEAADRLSPGTSELFALELIHRLEPNLSEASLKAAVDLMAVPHKIPAE
jgi:hypothetical protein